MIGCSCRAVGRGADDVSAAEEEDNLCRVLEAEADPREAGDDGGMEGCHSAWVLRVGKIVTSHSAFSYEEAGNHAE